ncbi:MAG: glutathione S-transferase family protein [Rhodobiaceae bacterium]|nr:glutathione S-transferase family protein [Rhodobiaceae bacterium]
MILLGNHASPFTRKVRVLSAELGVDPQIEFQDPGALSPLIPNDVLVAAHPLGKMPILQLGDGTSLHDSRVICEYLNAEADGDLFPEEPAFRWQALSLQALADGLMDAAVATRYELSFREADATRSRWIERQVGRIQNAVSHMNGIAVAFAHRLTIGEISAACALGYLDFRFAEISWRAENPELAGWFETFAKRPSMTSTPPNPNQKKRG